VCVGGDKRCGVEVDCYIGKKQAVRMIGGEQCSESSSPSVSGVGPDGPLVVVLLFARPWAD